MTQVNGKEIWPLIREDWIAGETASEIGLKHNLTRGQVTGIVFRHAPKKDKTARDGNIKGLASQRRLPSTSTYKDGSVGTYAETKGMRFKQCQGFLDINTDDQPNCPHPALPGKSYCEAHQKAYFRKPSKIEKIEMDRARSIASRLTVKKGSF